jgi:hypothetical protein
MLKLRRKGGTRGWSLTFIRITLRIDCRVACGCRAFGSQLWLTLAMTFLLMLSRVACIVNM